MKKQLLFIFMSLYGVLSFGQNFQWAKNLGGIYDDFGRILKLDETGNIYVLSVSGSSDCILTKLDPSGNIKWSTNVGGEPYSIAIGKSGNIFLFGRFQGKIDFDPDTTIFNMSAEGQDDIFITKLKPTGKFLWSKRIGGKEREYPSSICLDKFENIHITGNYAGLVDFDPGTPTYKLTAKYYDIYIAKFDSSGNFIWTKTYGSYPFQNAGLSILVDYAGNIITIGDFSGKVDFAPNSSLTAKGGSDGFVLKLDPDGKFKWVKNFNGPLNEEMLSVASDPFGNIYTTGSFEDSVDFDPGNGKYYLGADRKKDIFISKLDSNGNFNWAKSIGGPSVDIATFIALDDLNDVYVTGFFDDSVDFDPGTAKHYLFGENTRMIFTVKLSSSGNFEWAKKIGGISDYHYHSVAVDKKRNVYTVGTFRNSTDFDPDESAFYLTPVGQLDAFISKLGPCPSPAEAIKGQSNFCSPKQTAVYSIGQASGANGYKWSVPSDAKINSGQNTNSINVTFGTSAGNIKVIPANACDTNAITSLNIKINQPPKVVINVTPSATVCKGISVNLSGTGASTYEWSGGIINGQSFTANSSETYTMKGTDLNGCSDTAVLNLRVNIKPAIILDPVEQYSDVGSNAEFVVAASFSEVFQWQQWVGSAYVNLSNTSQFFGVNNDTLTIKNVTPSQNQLKFRCNIGEPGCSTFSKSASLYVNKGGIQTSLKNKSFFIYPNPATNLITIESNHTLSKESYTITDQTGRQILKGELNSKINTLDISNLAKGFYFLQIGEMNRETFKIVKQ